MKAFFFLLAIAMFTACSSPQQKFEPDLFATNHIDTNEYAAIQKKFKLSIVDSARNYLGALSPNYPIAHGLGDLLKRDTGATDWLSGGMLPLYHVFIIKKGTDYVQIKAKKQLKQVYAPISSEEEALSYAAAYTRCFPVFKKSFFKPKYKYYIAKPELSYSKKNDDYFLVHLFSYQAYGCEHPYYSVLFNVTTMGEVIELKKTKAFEDLEEVGLCVD